MGVMEATGLSEIRPTLLGDTRSSHRARLETSLFGLGPAQPLQLSLAVDVISNGTWEDEVLADRMYNLPPSPWHFPCLTPDRMAGRYMEKRDGKLRKQDTLEEGHAGIRHRRIILIRDPAVVA